MPQPDLPPGELSRRIEDFLARCKSPVFLEEGEEPLPLERNNHSLEERNGGLMFQCWSAGRCVSRWVVGLAAERRGRLELRIRKFAARDGSITLFDSERASGRLMELQGERRSFREYFRRFLRRQFTGWTLAELTTEADLENSLSPRYSRALLRKGSEGWAAMGVSRETDAGGSVTFGLIWLDYLRRREPRLAIHGLVFLAPDGAHSTICLRVRWLNPEAFRTRLFVYGEDGREQEADPADFGNLETHLDPCNRERIPIAAEVAAWMARLTQLPGVEQVRRPTGDCSLRVRGLEFAATREGRLIFGIDHRGAVAGTDLAEMERAVMELARLRSSGAADVMNPLYRRNPEAWLESQIRANLAEIHAPLVEGAVYGQVPAFAAGERGVIDLVAVERTGRLTVIEVKASEDIHLPLQALDYWMRVKWHLEREDFSRLGYFPGVALTGELPRLLLVAPALAFHRANELVLRYFSPLIAVERIGVAVKWREQLRVMFRLPGAGGREVTACPWQTRLSRSGERSST